MSFLWIELLWLLLLVPALVAGYIVVQRRRQKYALRYASLSLVKEALGRGPGIRRHVPPVLFLIAITAMIVGVARPVATVVLPSQQGTIILTFDVSGSMRADDIKPTRLEAAKAAARLFVDKQPRNVSIGVVSFGSDASIVQAPTRDREAVLAAINRLAPQRRTAIGGGIVTSLSAIFDEPVPTPSGFSRNAPLAPEPTPTPLTGSRGTYAPAVVVLLSDGVSNTGPRPLDVVGDASDRGVRVYTVGLGSPDGTILNVEGFSIRVRLDEETLKEIAEKTGADYLKAESETDLSDIYQGLSTRLVFKAEQTELTAAFTGLAVILLLVAGTLSLLWFSRLP